MKRNTIRIVCNPYTNKISYFFRNELGEWELLTGSSPLSRQYYTRTTIEERHKDIIEKLDEIYNRKNKGLDIFFEGTSTNYSYISDAIKKYLPDRDLICEHKMTKIAVVGKKASGKSILIKGIENEIGNKFETIKNNQYVQYIDKNNNINWIELNGIDFGINEISKATDTIQDLVKDGLTTVIYCISGVPGHIEDTEKKFVENINAAFPSIKVLTVLTQCYKDEVQTVIDEAEKLTNHMEVFPTLAKEYRVRGTAATFVVTPFGIKELCAFVFEGKKLPHQFQDELKASTTYFVQKPNTSNKRLEEKRIVDKNHAHEKKTDLSGIEQPESIEPEKNIISKVVRETDHCTKNDEHSKDMPTRNVPASSVKEIKSVDIPKKKPVFKKIAIVGKKGVGKTTLIEGMGTYIGRPFIKENSKNYAVYEDRKSNIQWYEVKGIDLGKDKIEEAYTTVKGLIEDGLKTIFYCICGGAGKIEDLELNLIRRLITEYPKVSVVIVLTMCYKEEEAIQDTVNEIKKLVGKSEIVQTLARDYKTRIKIPKTGEPFIIPSFGLDSVYWHANGEQ